MPVGEVAERRRQRQFWGGRTVVQVVLEEVESSRWPGLGASRMQVSGAVVEVVASATDLAGAPGSAELNPCRPEVVRSCNGSAVGCRSPPGGD